MTDVWIVVANRTNARILNYRKGAPATELETLAYPEARQPERSVLTDAPGRTHDSRGPGRHSMERPTSVATEMAHLFARQIAERVEHGRVNHAWQNLVLVAGPKFLGVLRQELSSQCRERVLGEIPKNMVTHSVEEIVSKFPYELEIKLTIGPG